MKKNFFIIMVSVIICLVAWLIFVQKNEDKPNDAIVHSTGEETIFLKFAHHMPEKSIIQKAALQFKKEIEKKTNNKVQVNIYPNQELGNAFEMIEHARIGNIDILITPTAKISTTIPSMMYVDLPYLFPQIKDAYALLDGKLGDILLNELNSIGLLGISFWGGGYKSYISNKPLEKTDDFKDLKIRVMKSRVLIEQVVNLGAKPVLIDFHSTKKALTDGVINALEPTLFAIPAMGFDNVATDLTLSQHGFLVSVLSFSSKRFASFPLNIQTALMQTAKKVTRWQRDEVAKANQKAFENIQKSTLNIHHLSPKVQERLKQAKIDITKKYEDTIGSHIISKTQEYMYQHYNQEDVVVIGVDADLSMGAKGAGLAIKRGVELAVDEINSNGGLLSKKVVLVAKDHKGNSTQARENIKEFIKDKNTLAVIGGKHSAIISSYMKEIQENQLLFFSPWAAASTVTQNGYDENFIFRVSLNDLYATKFIAQEALKRAKNPLIVVENSIWGKEALNNINLYFQDNGIQKQEGIIINRGQKQFKGFLDVLLTQKYDSLIMILNAQESDALVEMMWKNNIFIPITSHWGMVGDAFFEANKDYLKDIDLRFIQTFSLHNHSNQRAKKLAQTYQLNYFKEPNEKINAITGVVQAYDSVMLLAKAIHQAKSFDSSLVKKSLYKINKYEGVIKTYKNPFNKINHDALKADDFFMAHFGLNGQILPIEK